MQEDISNLNNRGLDNSLQHRKILTMSDSSLKRIRPRHLEPKSFSDDKTSSLDFIVPDPKDIDFLRMQLVEQEAIDRRLQKKEKKRS